MCNAEAPSVEEATKRWAGQATFVGVATSGSQDEYQGFIDKHGLTFPQISDSPGEIFARFEIWSTPGLVVISPSGDISTLSESNDEVLDMVINQALAEG